MPGFKNDGTTQVNTRVLTIGSAAGGAGGKTYVAENFQVQRPSKTIEQTDANDEPLRQYSYVAWVTGSATLQLSASTVELPQLGWEFTTTIDVGTTPAPVAEIFYISEMGKPEGQGIAQKVNVQFRKKYN